MAATLWLCCARKTTVVCEYLITRSPLGHQNQPLVFLPLDVLPSNLKQTVGLCKRDLLKFQSTERRSEMWRTAALRIASHALPRDHYSASACLCQVKLKVQTRTAWHEQHRCVSCVYRVFCATVLIGGAQIVKREARLTLGGTWRELTGFLTHKATSRCSI